MRTAIEMRPEHRARTLELAANRGEKGFSAVVAEALDFYLVDQKGADAVGLSNATRNIRANWR